MKKKDISKTADTPASRMPDTDNEDGSIEDTAPDVPVASEANDAGDRSVADTKAGTGAGMSDAVMPSSIDSSDSDMINNNLEALASGRMHLHVGN